jgi:predicted ATPase
MNDPDLALQAHQALGITAFCRGQNESSLQHVEQAAALYDPARHRTHSFQFGQDPGVICKAFGAVVLWLTGYPDAAARQSEEAICMSDDLSPSSQAVAFYFASMVYQLRGDHRRTRGHAEACSAVATEHGFSFWMAGSNILRGWALAADGAVSEGTAAMRQGLLDWQATGSVTYRTLFLGILAQTLLRRDDVADSRLLLDEALAVAGQTGEGLYEPELHRLIGESLLASTSDPDDAEALAQAEEKFHQAVSLARSQNAKSLELRAAISLARMSARQNVSSAAARQTLAETYACFTEGLDTPDLVAARELCDSFSEE